MERVECDVLVVGAGGAGLRAAISAAEAGAQVALVSKSLLGKAHTVMAEGGVAAALGNMDERDSWKVHFRDTIKGGKGLGNWEMAKLHGNACLVPVPDTRLLAHRARRRMGRVAAHFVPGSASRGALQRAGARIPAGGANPGVDCPYPFAATEARLFL